MVDLKRRRFSPESEATGFLKSLQSKVQAYQNIIFFVLLIVSLIILLFIWRSYREKKQSTEVWSILTQSQNQRVEALQDIARRYASTRVIPFIRYKLANAYFDDNKYSEAQKEYEYLLTAYPKHPVREWVERRLSQLRITQEWETSELARCLAELKELANLPLVTIKTKKGDFQVELYEDDAPNTVANFINLAEQGFYNQTPFSKKDPELGLCLGDKGKPLGYTIPFESNDLKHKAGSVGMIREIDPEAKEGKEEREAYLNSTGAKFYICYGSQPSLDGKYTVFGQVVKGMDEIVVRSLTKGVEIAEIVINKKRDHEYKPKTIKKK